MRSIRWATVLCLAGTTACSEPAPEVRTHDGAATAPAEDASTTPNPDPNPDPNPNPDPDPNPNPQPIDPAVALARACPAGANVNVRLWNVMATPRRPDGDVWDGQVPGTYELVCSIAAEAIRERTSRYIDSAVAPGAGTVLDRIAGEQYERAVRELCGLSAGWLQARFEGPDMFANALTESGTPAWTSIQVEDRWLALLNQTRAGSPVAWQAPCDSQEYQGTLRVTDSDVAFNDPMATIPFILPTRVPSVLCDGWGYLQGSDGIVGAVFRVTVDRPQQCAGITGASLRDLEIPRVPPTANVPVSTVGGVRALAGTR